MNLKDHPAKPLNPILLYLLKFFGIFCLCYYGTRLLIGLAAPVGHYSPFVHNYLDYVSWIKISLINGATFILSWFHVTAIKEAGFALQIVHGKGIIIAMSCVGYAVDSFWIAFVVANKGTAVRKIIWLAGGLLILWIINVIRITLYLQALNNGWPMPLGLDHHTWFNIAAYTMIFLMIWLYDRTSKNKILRNSGK